MGEDPKPNVYHFAYSLEHHQHFYTVMCHQYPDRQIWHLVSDGKIIIELNYLPTHINPDNINDKIQMLLTFM